MRQLPGLVLGLFAALAFVPAALGQADEGLEGGDEEIVDVPRFTLGDWWQYRLKGEMTGIVNNTMARRENLTFNGTEYDVWRITADVDAAPVTRTPYFTHSFVEDKWVMADTHAKFRTYAETSDEGERVTRRDTFKPPQPELQFPLAEGSEWTHESRVMREQTRTLLGVDRPDVKSPQYFTDKITGQVVGKVRLTTPAGTFITYLIEFSSSDLEVTYLRWYYAPEACTNVLEEYYETEGDASPRIVYELMAYKCTEPAPPLEDTEDVAEEPPAPTWLDNTTKPESGAADNWLPGFEAPLLAAALAAACLWASRRRR